MRRERLSPKRLGQEALIMAFILFNAYLLPFAWSFALYFCILHSSRVLQEEYAELRAHRIVQNVKSFLLLATPFSVLSYIGIVLLYIASAQGIISISPLLIILALVAVITLPHGVVMDYFYRHGHG
jgi:Brp/Blh family beta-carotene 15,15'-monooxygenase